MADSKAYILQYTSVIPTGNLNEFIIYMDVALAYTDTFRSQVSPMSLQ